MSSLAPKFRFSVLLSSMRRSLETFLLQLFVSVHFALNLSLSTLLSTFTGVFFTVLLMIASHS